MSGQTGTQQPRTVPGIQSSREFVYHTIQRQHNDKPMRMSVLGLSWPVDKGEWLPLIAGRALRQNHFEIVADKTLGLQLGERIPLGKETYTIVGITSGMVSSGGDGMAFTTSWDSQAIQFDNSGESVRLERAARASRGQDSTGGHRVCDLRAFQSAGNLESHASEPKRRSDGIDSHRGRQVMELFRTVAREHGAGVIVVTHDQRTLEVFDTIYEMEDGVIHRLNTNISSHVNIKGSRIND